MCGLVAIYGYHESADQVDKSELIKIRDHMIDRGPDAKGIWFSNDNRVGFGHRRLSIIDLSNNASQPMTSEDEKFVITFNGEIYNYQDLRKYLKGRGYIFKTESDTEVLLQLYIHKGQEMVHDLRGMYAFSIWDENKKGLFIARDGYGIKPLYYNDDGKTFRTASQVKALLAGKSITSTIDAAGLVGFYLMGSVPEPFTTYKNIKPLPAGTSLWIDKRGVHKPKKFFSVPEIFSIAERQIKADSKIITARYAEQIIHDELLESVKYHLVSDVPVGGFLSAGIDSSALIGLMRDARQYEIKTVTLGFDEFSGLHHDETILASKLAKHYETNHSTRLVNEEEFNNDLPIILSKMDQPTIDGVNSWFVSKAMKEIGVKVAISGLGGDELFGGYNTFSNIPLWANRLSFLSRVPFMESLTQKILTIFRSIIPTLNPKLSGVAQYGSSYSGNYFLQRGLFMPWELNFFLDTDLIKDGIEQLNLPQIFKGKELNWPEVDYGQIASFESINYMRNQLLRDTDWTSMAHSLEVRVPLVDTILLEKIGKLLIALKYIDNSKSILASSPSKALPIDFIGRPKTGFSTPMASWISKSPFLLEESLPIFVRDSKVSWARKWACHVGNQYF